MAQPSRWGGEGWGGQAYRACGGWGLAGSGGGGRRGVEGGDEGGELGVGRRDGLRGCGRGRLGGFALELLEEEADEGGRLGGWGVGRGELGAWGDGAEDGVGDDLLYGAFLRAGGGGFGLGEVEGGDLEAVEEEAGAADVHLVGGELVEDVADGVLDGAPVLERGEGEGGVAVLALGVVEGGDGPGAAGAVVEAEVFVAEAGAAAAVAVGEDVAALEAAGGGVWHGYPLPRGTLVLKS